MAKKKPVDKISISNRRKHPRKNIVLPLQISPKITPEAALLSSDFKLQVQTKNISLGGICCKVDRFIPPFTCFEIILELPALVKEQSSKVKDLRKNTYIKCEGVVVWISPEKEKSGCKEYELALFFQNLSSDDADLLSVHLASKEDSETLCSGMSIN